MKFPCNKCMAECCYSPGLFKNEYEKFLAKLGPELVHKHEFPNGSKIYFIGEPGERCPLLTGNKCSIYEDRPEVCRLFGTVPELQCPKVPQIPKKPSWLRR